MKKIQKFATVLIKVVPKSAKEGVAGWEGDQLKIKIKEVPEEGKANLALIALLANTFGVSKQSITITKGETFPHKRLLILGINESDIYNLFPKEQGFFDVKPLL